jgi:D-glycero-alpha-D-manno-heptose 1-phosphate guanylyltransferase
MSPSDNDIKAVLLVGGMGTRLRSVVPSIPKPLAVVGERPFLELLVRQLCHQDIRRLVMCTGYRAQEIEHDLGDGHSWDATIEYSREPQPLGTAGAVKFAEPFLSEVSDFLVMNGDSFMEMDFRQLIQFHRKSGGVASMAVFRTRNEMRYGTVEVRADGLVSGFAEKTNADPNGLVNAGVYVFNRRILERIPEGPSSLERDVFPKLLTEGVYALEQQGVFIDIGTPEDYVRAQGLSDRLYDAARVERLPGPGDERPH